MSCCGQHGPGYASPQHAIKGPREKVLLVTTPHVDSSRPDAVCAVDVDPQSASFCQVLSKLEFPNAGDEVHHSGWNACSSCFGRADATRSHLITPCLNSDRIYVLNVEDPTHLRLAKTIEPELLRRLNVSFPHTSHCLADGTVMISTLGDKDGANRGNFLLLDGKTFDPTGLWLSESDVEFNYDFWYQPRRNVMISTEWGVPRLLKHGFDPEHMRQKQYGNSVHIFDWKQKTKRQTLELPLPEGAIPLEVRFHHEPSSAHCFVGTALGSSVFHLQPEAEDSQRYSAECIIKVAPVEVENWALPSMPGLITDILISMDDKFLYFSNWLHGDVRQYDITDPSNPKLTGQVWIGGSLVNDSDVKAKDASFVQPEPLVIKNRRIRGAPQMLQLSLDGRRLYITTSLYRPWDRQFYPSLLEEGGQMLQVDCAPDGGMALNAEFLVDFSRVEGGPYVAHEMRYPGGDCTSDIWI